MGKFTARVAVVVTLLFAVHTSGPTAETKKDAPSDEKINQFIKQLGDDSFDKREQATKELIDIGTPAIPHLRKALKDTTDLETRTRINNILDKVKSSPVYLRDTLRDTDPKVRKEAAERIAEQGAKLKELLPDLVEALKDKDEDVRDAVSVAIASIDPDNKAIAGSKIVKAMVSGKYSSLLRRFSVPNDKQSYGEFHDYGQYPATSYAGFNDLPAGYWVYVFPHWYIWGKMKEN